MDIEEIFDVDFTKKKPRGIAFSREQDNPSHTRWICLQCGMESNIGGIGNHQKKTGHVGKQRVLLRAGS